MFRQTMGILWASFLAASIAEACFFSIFDPRELLLHVGALRDWAAIAGSSAAGYTIGFFFFWSVCALAGMLTCCLANEVDQGRETRY